MSIRFKLPLLVLAAFIINILLLTGIIIFIFRGKLPATTAVCGSSCRLKLTGL